MKPCRATSPLFQTPLSLGASMTGAFALDYAVDTSGQRFLMAAPTEDTATFAGLP